MIVELDDLDEMIVDLPIDFLLFSANVSPLTIWFL